MQIIFYCNITAGAFRCASNGATTASVYLWFHVVASGYSHRGKSSRAIQEGKSKVSSDFDKGIGLKNSATGP